MHDGPARADPKPPKERPTPLSRPILFGGQYVANASPMNQSRGTGPQNRESSDCAALSPIMYQWSSGIVISPGKSQPGEPAQSCARARRRLAVEDDLARRDGDLSPGPATTRLMKFTSAFSPTGLEHSCVSDTSTAHFWPPPTAPTGGWKTMTLPISGSLKFCRSG